MPATSRQVGYTWSCQANGVRQYEETLAKRIKEHECLVWRL